MDSVNVGGCAIGPNPSLCRRLLLWQVEMNSCKKLQKAMTIWLQYILHVRQKWSNLTECILLTYAYTGCCNSGFNGVNSTVNQVLKHTKHLLVIMLDWLVKQENLTLLFFLKPKSSHTQCPDPPDPIILHSFTTRHWGTCYASFNIAIWKRRTFIQLQPLTSGVFACTHPKPKQELIFAYLVLSWLVFVQALPFGGGGTVGWNQAFVGHLALGFLSWAFQSHSPAYI